MYSMSVSSEFDRYLEISALVCAEDALESYIEVATS